MCDHVVTASEVGGNYAVENTSKSGGIEAEVGKACDHVMTGDSEAETGYVAVHYVVTVVSPECSHPHCRVQGTDHHPDRRSQGAESEHAQDADEHGYALPTGIALLSPCRPSSRYVAPLIAMSPLSSLRRPSSRHVAPLVAISPLSLPHCPCHYVTPFSPTSPLLLLHRPFHPVHHLHHYLFS
ncbi:hypothetical protein BYT27DRAFT_7262641 [Phlegmacium glaucopus]|nr:hypothetical protein BYT27DRAFT_7262641 [Phlegmacium glaucopus]